FDPATVRASLDYLFRRGGLLLGLVRFDGAETPVGACAAAGVAGYRSPGTDNVYGLRLAEVLAAADEPDRLVLQLYGTLAHAGAPTLFGPLSFRLTSHLADGYVDAWIVVPDRDRIDELTLRLRVPGRRRIAAVWVDGVPHAGFDPADESVDLSGRTGALAVRV